VVTLQTAKTWHYVTAVFIANTWQKQLISAQLLGKGCNGTLNQFTTQLHVSGM
jgi:hypothetical protein